MLQVSLEDCWAGRRQAAGACWTQPLSCSAAQLTVQKFCIMPCERSALVVRQPACCLHPCRLLGDTEESYVGLLHYFLRTKQLMEKRGPLPTSRQDARARQRQKQEQEQEAPQAQAQQQQAGAAAGSVAAPEEQQERQQEGQQELQQERQQEQQQLVGKGLVADVPSDQQQQAALAGGGQGLLPDSPSHNRKATSV